MIFKRNKQKARPNFAVGLDLGTRQIKAALIRREGAALQLSKYAVRTQANGTNNAEQYAADLREAVKQLGTEDQRIRVTLSCNSAMVCHAEFPRVPLQEVKAALQNFSAQYLRRDYSDYYLDVFELEDGSSDPKPQKSALIKVLCAGAKRDEVNWYRNALAAAKIKPSTIELTAVSVVNALQVCESNLCEKDVVLLLDIGARSTSMNILRQGHPLMTRITQFGGDLINEYVGQMLKLEPKAAEEEKWKMSDAVQPLIRQSLGPLVREIRSSIDFFERQHECHVARALACGGSACSPALLEIVSEEVGFRIEPWNPVSTFDTAHFNGEGPQLTALAPSLAAAIGAATGQL
ncbi:MAG: Cell division protein FtsA [Verrucomicrobiae bacterium]|nr:Cell division protein FtsA [Verrucomicrobiae bacterium]